MRYAVIAGSYSGHCCFDWTVVDMRRPNEKFEGDVHAVCECFDEDDARLICAALNEKATCPANSAA